MKFPSALLFSLVLSLAAAISYAAETKRPNILVILADDLGYADVGFQGCKDIPTPNLDQLAARSVRCTNGYVSHPFCSPTRAGLLTGRYQQRFGHENNPAWLPESTVAGLPLSQTTLPQVLKTAGYTTGAVGKWHLGAHPQFHPNRRGFDEYFGMLGGGHNYLPEAKAGQEYMIPMDRNGTAEPLKGYLTEELGREAGAFIQRHKTEPWFLYLAFNAPHTPLQTTLALLERAKHIGDETRRGYATLVLGLDDAIGATLQALRESGQEENTAVFFFSDNGGPISVTHSQNTPLRAAKGSVFEGGMHVPFLVSWPGKIAAGKDYAHPVISLDVFPTAAALAGAQVPDSVKLDGVNILPFLTGEKSGLPHERLFWRTGGDKAWAMREGRYKLVRIGGETDLLFDLEADIAETKDLRAAQPELAAKMATQLDAWNAQLVPPIFESPRVGKPQQRRGPAKVQ
jgi:arylsulfatase A-like enzyme